MSGAHSTPAMTFSVGLYRLLLLAYPRDFRVEYGAAMMQVFRDRSRQRVRDSGNVGLLLWWAITLVDFFGSLVEEHLRRENYMTRSTLIRISGWALIIAAVAFVLAGALLPQEQANDAWAGTWAMLMATMLGAVGALGVLAHFHHVISIPARAALLVGVVASAIILTVLTDAVWELEWGWLLPFAGPAMLLASLAVFGIWALQQNALSPAASWALIAGFWFAILLIAVLITGLAGEEPNQDLTVAWLTVGSLITGFGLARLGWRLQSHPDPLPTPS